MTVRVVSADMAPSIVSDMVVNPEQKAPVAHQADATKTESPFASLVSGAVRDASELDVRAGAKVDKLAAGVSDDIHGTMIAVKEAEISVKLLGTIRNQLLDAFHEIWRTSV